MSFFYRLFPPPRYIDFPIVGVDISDRSIKFIEFKNTRKGFRLKRFGKKKLDPGLIVSGQIKKQDELATFLASFFKPLGIRNIVAALPEERAFVSAIQLPKIESQNIREAIELVLAEYIPLPAGEAVFDFEMLPATGIRSRQSVITEQNPDHVDVVVYAFPKVLVESYVGAYTDAGLVPIVFTMETQSLNRALIPAGGTDPVMIVDFGKMRTSFVIVSGEVVRFSSTVNIAGESLDQAIVKALKVTPKEAERIKKEKGMIKTKENEAVFNAILPIVSAVANEIERHRLFWNTHAEHVHKSSPEISGVILSGGDANLIGFKEYLSQQLKLPVTHGNPWVNVASFEDYIPEITSNESLQFSTAIGLGLRALEGE